MNGDNVRNDITITIVHFIKSILCLSVMLVRRVRFFVNSNKRVEVREFKKDNR